MRLLIIDGHNLLFQMFYGMPSRIVNANGQAIQGVIGFVGALLKMIGQTKPTHVVAVFDGEHENPRTALLPEYKANREDYSDAEEEDNPFSQLPMIYRALEEMGIRYYETADTEADDVIASYALSYGEAMEVVIASWDSDFFQLITENVRVLRYRGKASTLCDVSYLEEKLHIKAVQYADYKSLVGDTADNIKGVRGIGPKTAAALLQKYENLTGVLQEAGNHVGARIQAKSLQEAEHTTQHTTQRFGKVFKTIYENEAMVRRNYELIKLNNQAKLPFVLEELEYNESDRKTTKVLEQIGVLP